MWLFSSLQVLEGGEASCVGEKEISRPLAMFALLEGYMHLRMQCVG